MPAMDEAARQRELDGQHLVDSLPEAAYDDIVTLAALICDAPIALVTLIDRDRQWFKASTGLDDAGSRRDEAFCNHAIAKPDQMMEVPDAHDDARFTGNRLVTGPLGIRYYAGMPLVSPNGAAFGTVCVLDRQPRFLDAPQKEGLAALARLTMTLFEARHWRLRAEREALLAAALVAPAAVAATGISESPFTVVLVELMDAAGAASRLGMRELERTLQRLVDALQARLAPGDSVDRVSGSHELIAVLHGAETSAASRALTDAVSEFERETGLHVLLAESPAVSSQEPVMAVYLRAEIMLSNAKNDHITGLSA
ncbi:MAG: GAF domain-containing protein [Thermomonas sp.]